MTRRESRADLFRKHALEAESKAFNAATENSQRAWLIVARDWTKMAEQEELRFLAAPESKLAPDSDSESLEDNIQRLAATAYKYGKAVGP